MFLAVCNAKYEFKIVNIGNSGRQTDGSIYNNSHLRFTMENDTLNLSDLDVVGSNPEYILPYVFLDNAFGLKCHMMKLYPDPNILLDERIFNYRCSRARRIIEMHLVFLHPGFTYFKDQLL